MPAVRKMGSASTRSERAGKYVRQSGGYAAFYPAPLPPSPHVKLDGRLAVLLSEADNALGRLDGSVTLLPDPDLFVFMYIRKEAVLSSQIEGTEASLLDLLEYEARTSFNQKPLGDVAEILNYIDAMNYGLKRLDSLPVSLRLIREIHGMLLKNVRGGEFNRGEFRHSQNHIGSPGCSIQDAIFVPPPAHIMHPALDSFEKFLHSDMQIPTLIKVGMAHAQFETIHPFIDGNGRVGRLMITFLLCQQKMLHKPLLYLSYYFHKNRRDYYAALQAVRDEGDWEGWLRFFLQGVVEVSAEATETARRILALREDHRSVILSRLGRGASPALRLLAGLYNRPLVGAKDVKKITGLSTSNSYDLIKAFVDLGLLSETTGQKRNKVFAYRPYLALFSGTEMQS